MDRSQLPETDPGSRTPLPLARYDEFADWYHDWIGDSPGLIWAEGLLPEDLSGRRVLDAACGPGRLSGELARRGADVVAVDVSSAQIEIARARPTPGPGRIDHHLGDLARPEGWWDGISFDGAVSEMALQDVEDLPGAVAALARVMRPGGWVFVSMVHPCFPGSATGLSSWPPEGGYATEGWWTSPQHNPDGARIRVGSHHRRLSTYLNAFVTAGFQLERATEPSRELPVFLVLAWRRSADGPGE